MFLLDFFNQINAALLSIRDILQTHLKILLTLKLLTVVFDVVVFHFTCIYVVWCAGSLSFTVLCLNDQNLVVVSYFNISFKAGWK